MTLTSGIYKIICTENDNYYYGSSINLRNRWLKHLRTLRKQNHENSILQRTWNKYGPDSLQFEIVEYSKPETLLEVEDKYLKEHVGKPHCMNIGATASSPMLGKHHTSEALYKISEAGKNNKYSLGYKHSEETRKKMSESHKGAFHNEETKRKIGEAARNISEETRKKMSEARIGTSLSEEIRKKISNTKKGKHHTIETRRKMSAAAIAYNKHKHLEN